jgi:hypothetical protein
MLVAERTSNARVTARLGSRHMVPRSPLRKLIRQRFSHVKTLSLKEPGSNHSHALSRPESVLGSSQRGTITVAAEFLKAFPTLETVLIESWQEGAGVGNPYTSTLPSRTYGLPLPVTSPIISCANRHCRDGGFDIFQDISEMVHEKLTTKEFVKVCLGNERFPRGGKLGQNCINTLHYRLTLRYESEY